MKENDGGPAFPRNGHPDMNDCPESGMSLRDYFAAKAMQSLMPILKYDIDELTEGKKGRMIAVCQMSYDYADAMLEARENKNQKEVTNCLIQEQLERV